MRGKQLQLLQRPSSGRDRLFRARHLEAFRCVGLVVLSTSAHQHHWVAQIRPTHWEVQVKSQEYTMRICMNLQRQAVEG